MTTSRVAVVGATGFVGSAVMAALHEIGVHVVPVKAPRLAPVGAESAESAANADQVAALVSEFAGCSAVVNAAGNPDASVTDEAILNAANGALVGVLAEAAKQTPAHPRFVHVSSAVVQGRATILDDAPANADFSAYARSKVLGERLALEHGPEQTVVYRPPSVHASDRRVSRTIARLAASPLAVVAAPGTQSTPQALIANVGSAVAFLATCPDQPPQIVTHPSEGLTVTSLMEALGGRRPRRIPRRVARIGAGVLERVGRRVPIVSSNARRAELILFGQAQAESWLTTAGWSPPQGVEGWHLLGATLAKERPEDE